MIRYKIQNEKKYEKPGSIITLKTTPVINKSQDDCKDKK